MSAPTDVADVSMESPFQSSSSRKPYPASFDKSGVSRPLIVGHDGSPVLTSRAQIVAIAKKLFNQRRSRASMPPARAMRSAVGYEYDRTR